MQTKIDWRASFADPATAAADCVVAGFWAADKSASKAKNESAGKPKLTAAAARIDRACGRQLSKFLAGGDAAGKVGDMHMLYHLRGLKGGLPAARVLLLGLGAKDKFNAANCANAARVAVKLIDKHGLRTAYFCGWDDLGLDPRRAARILAEAGGDALYTFHTTKSKPPKKVKLKRVTLHCARVNLHSVRRGLREGAAIAAAVTRARDYANLPGNICTPTFLADEAKKLAKEFSLRAQILDEKQMQKLGMGSLLSVSRGSRQPAKLIVLQYRGAQKSAAPVALVGKGLTFDAGGISLKPAAAMDEMKYDMCGGAAVFGAVAAAAELQLKINLVGLIPCSENLPDGDANKPGDVVTAMSGTTIEILNTDAEGRLILCDALTYAKRFKPAAVVDIATLTGACVIALGDQASGLFSNCDALAEELLRAGKASGDRAWRMPVWDEYDAQLKSNFADFANIGGRGAGAVTAACFLKQFAADFHWAHLDVAGTAWRSGANKGATGRPVPLLVEFLLNRARD